MTIQSLINYLNEHHAHLLSNITGYNFMTEYNAHSADLDYTLIYFRDLVLSYNDEVFTETLYNKIKTDIRSLFIRNKYKYEKLWDTTNFDYNPIYNKDFTIKYDFGKQHGTSEDYAHTDELTYNIGNRSKTIGSHNDSSSHTSNGYEYNNLGTADGSDAYSYGSRTDTSASAVDSITNEYGDKNREWENDAYHNEEHQSGNVGVTTTQKMIGEEREIVNFSFWNIIYNDIIDCITIPYWECE